MLAQCYRVSAACEHIVCFNHPPAGAAGLNAAQLIRMLSRRAHASGVSAWPCCTTPVLHSPVSSPPSLQDGQHGSSGLSRKRKRQSCLSRHPTSNGSLLAGRCVLHAAAAHLVCFMSYASVSACLLCRREACCGHPAGKASLLGPASWLT